MGTFKTKGIFVAALNKQGYDAERAEIACEQYAHFGHQGGPILLPCDSTNHRVEHVRLNTGQDLGPVSPHCAPDAE